MKEQNKTHYTGFTKRGLQDPAIMIPKDCVRKGWRWSEFHEVYLLNLPSSLISLEVKDKSMGLSNKICCSVAQSRSTLCNTVDCNIPGFPGSSQSPGVCSNSCPLHQWCHPTISSSVISFFFCLQSFPASGSFPMSQLVALGGQSSGASASASVLPMDSQG